jgi:hypothetical protein
MFPEDVIGISHGHGAGIDSASKSNENQEYFLGRGVKAFVAKG